MYLETSFISACVTNRTTIRALYEHEASLQWLADQSHRHELFCSDATLAELSSRKYPLRKQALEAAVQFTPLLISPEMEAFAVILANRFVMPQDLKGDALHVAAATIAEMDCLLTWNVKHLANAKKERHLRVVCGDYGLIAPRILRPDAFIQELET